MVSGFLTMSKVSHTYDKVEVHDSTGPNVIHMGVMEVTFCLKLEKVHYEIPVGIISGSR